MQHPRRGREEPWRAPPPCSAEAEGAPTGLVGADNYNNKIDGQEGAEEEREKPPSSLLINEAETVYLDMEGGEKISPSPHQEPDGESVPLITNSGEPAETQGEGATPQLAPNKTNIALFSGKGEGEAETTTFPHDVVHHILHYEGNVGGGMESRAHADFSMGGHNLEDNPNFDNFKPKVSPFLGGKINPFTGSFDPDYDPDSDYSDSGSINVYSEWDDPGWETESENSDSEQELHIDTDTHSLFVAGHSYAPAAQPAAASVPAQPGPQPSCQPQPTPQPAQQQ